MSTSVIDIMPARFRWYEFSEWGGHFRHAPSSEKPSDTEVYVHHTAGSRLSQNGPEAFRRLQDQAYGRNYATVAYDIMVHRSTDDGTISIGGGRMQWRSAATRDRNEIGEAVVLMGYFHPGHKLSQAPTADELEGLAYAIAILIERGLVVRTAFCLGHRDNPAHPGATACPGDYLYPHIAQVWHRALELLDMASGTLPPPPPPPVTDLGQYLVRQGDSPWKMAEMFLGNGTRWPEIVAANGGKQTPHPGERWNIPGYTGRYGVVQNGDGSISFLRRELGVENPSREQKNDLYDWNGGNPYDGERPSYQPGEQLWIDLT